jgi:hypothetical protein
MSENDDPFFRMRQHESPVLVLTPEEIFKGQSEKDLSVFVNEFYMVFSILEKLDKDYDQGDSVRTEKNVKKFRSLVKDWNKKYRDLLLVFSADGIQCRLTISFAEDLQGVADVIRRMNRFMEMRSFSATRLNAVFAEASRKGENTLTLESDGSTVTMIHSKEDMLKPESPEFRICAYYAMKDGFDRSIDLLQKYKESFSFGSESSEKYGWNSRWNVKFLR